MFYRFFDLLKRPPTVVGLKVSYVLKEEDLRLFYLCNTKEIKKQIPLTLTRKSVFSTQKPPHRSTGYAKGLTGKPGYQNVVKIWSSGMSALICS